MKETSGDPNFDWGPDFNRVLDKMRRMPKRYAGYYYVRLVGTKEWLIGQYLAPSEKLSYWYLPGTDREFSDHDFDEIGDSVFTREINCNTRKRFDALNELNYGDFEVWEDALSEMLDAAAKARLALAGLEKMRDDLKLKGIF